MRTRWVSRNTSGRDIVVGDVHGCFRTLDRALDGASEPIVNDALLGLNAPREAIVRHRMRGVEGVRVLVHGHEPVEQVERVANRWNIHTGAGIASLNRLSLVEVNAAELRT